MSGNELETLDVGRLAQSIESISIFYRVTPRHKLKIVKVNVFMYPSRVHVQHDTLYLLFLFLMLSAVFAQLDLRMSPEI